MKYKCLLILLVYLFAASICFANEYTFNYKYQKVSFQIKQIAPDVFAASKIAASKCFQKLTNNKYPGEQIGLNMIDACANPNSTMHKEWYK